MIPIAAKMSAICAVLAAAFAGGWHTRSIVQDVLDTKQAEAIKRAEDAFHAQEQQIARTLETKLAQLKANETVIEREIPKIIDRPVYRNVCLDDDGLRVLEKARTGKASAGTPSDEVPGTFK